jgi:hypothetical protein
MGFRVARARASTHCPEGTIMGRSYDDEYGYSSHDVITAAITAEELAEVLHSPDTDLSELAVLDASLDDGFADFEQADD